MQILLAKLNLPMQIFMKIIKSLAGPRHISSCLLLCFPLFCRSVTPVQRMHHSHSLSLFGSYSISSMVVSWSLKILVVCSWILGTFKKYSERISAKSVEIIIRKVEIFGYRKSIGAEKGR